MSCQLVKFNFNEGWLLKLGDTKIQNLLVLMIVVGRLYLFYVHGMKMRLSAFHVMIFLIQWCGTESILNWVISFIANILLNLKAWNGLLTDVYLNGHKLGISENGVMAFGFDLTPYVKSGDNVIAVRVDNNWNYRERATNQRYQWNDKISMPIMVVYQRMFFFILQTYFIKHFHCIVI